jgi:tetratricopeptide (TPR) repeat protein
MLLQGDHEVLDPAYVDHNSDALFAYFQANAYDARLLAEYGRELSQLAPHLSPTQKQALLVLLNRCLANVYYFPGEKDAYYWLAEILYSLELYSASISFYEQSQHYYGQTAYAFYSIGFSYEKLGQFDAAITHYEGALAQDPNYTPAQSALKKAQTQKTLCQGLC